MYKTLNNTIDTWNDIVQDAVVDVLHRRPKQPVVKSQPIKCRECGRSNVTLRKCSDGFYICNDCLRKGGEQ